MHQVSKSTHLDAVTDEDNEQQNKLEAALRKHGSKEGRERSARKEDTGGRSYLSMITGSEGVSFLLPQLFLSQHRLGEKKGTLERYI